MVGSNNLQLEELIDKIRSVEVSSAEALPLIGKYLNNYSVTDIDLVKIYSYLSEIIAYYETEFNNSLEADERATFHYIMDCFMNQKVNLTPIENYLVERYKVICQNEEKTEGVSNSYIKRKLHPDYKPSLLEESLELNPYGLTLIPIIIVVTVILGAVLAAFLLVK